MPEQKDVYNILIDLSDTIRNAAHSLDALSTFDSFPPEQKEKTANATIKELIEHINEQLAEIVDKQTNL